MSAIPSTENTLEARRRSAVDATLHDVRQLLAGQEPTRETLQAIIARLERLAEQKPLFTRADFPPPAISAGVEASTRYRLNPADGDGGLALYLNSINPGKTTLPHDHTTWAVIVAVEGQEINHIYRRTDDRSQADRGQLELVRDLTVQPGTPTGFLGTDIHSIEVVGEQPTLHFHLYGRPLETLSGRVGYQRDGRIVNYNATQFHPSKDVA
ncbi:MAG: cysteine dioxygenase family protein [Curvibacter sp.]|nr:cysteine dioxygenase family protein [Curvibacter sp.]